MHDGTYAILNHLQPAITRRRFLVAGSSFAIGAVIAPAKGRATGPNNRRAAGAAPTRAIHLLPKVYRLDSPISLPSDTSVYFNGATLEFTDATSRPAAYLQGEGTAAAAIPLSLDATRGDRAIKLTDASTIGPEDMLRLWSTAKFDPGATDSYKGEMVTVSSVAGNVVRLTGDVQDDYNTAEAAQVEKITPVENIRLIGPGKIQGDDTAHSTDYAISFYRARKCSVEGLDLREVDLAHIRFRDAVDCHARHCRIEMTRTISTGYGVSFADATQDCSAMDNWFRRCRHSLSTNNSSNYGGVPRCILFENNFVLDSARSSHGAGGDAIDVHSAAENITIRGNHVLGSTGHGINVECSSAAIESNYIEDVGHDSSLAYAIHAVNRTGRVGTLSVKNNTLKHIQGSRGINILKHPTAGIRYDGVQVSGNEVTMSEDDSTCIFLTDLKHVVVANNRLQINGSGTTIRGIFVVGTTPGSANAGVISANNIHLNSTARSCRGVELDNEVANHGVWNNTIEGATAKAGVILGSGAGNVASDNLLI